METEVKKAGADKEKEPLAQSRYSGGAVRIVPFHIAGPDGGEAGVSHEYIGIGPLLVPCTRGEQKAESGDVLVEVLKADPDNPGVDLVYLFLLPREVAEVLKTELVDTPPATQMAYQKFLDDRLRRGVVVIPKATPAPASHLATQTASKTLTK